MKSSGIGGQAVLEGVMMKNKNRYAVAVRKPDGEIAVDKGECSSIIERHKILGVPVVRGVVNFVESLVLGMKMLTSSASYFDDVEEQPGKLELWIQKKFGEKADKVIMGGTVFCSIVMAIAIFMLLPLAIVSFIDEDVISYEWKTLLEGLLRLAIFLGYIVLISCLKDIRRVFMYHGAEHKTINCIEQGMAPTVENVRKCSRQHKRCGTSFLLFVMLISVLFFLLVRVETIWLRFIVRILFVPVIAGLSYEFIRFAGSSDSKVMNVLSKPGLWLQGLTTREPDDDMICVAVASVEAVFDWHTYLEENFAKKSQKKAGSAEKSETGGSASEKEVSPKKAQAKPASGEAVSEKKVNAKEAQVKPASGESAPKKKASVKEAQIKPASGEAAPKKVNVKEAQAENVSNEAAPEEEVASKFDWSFPSVKKNAPESTMLPRGRSRLFLSDEAEEASRAAFGETAATIQTEDEEEEDEILKALDKYFVFEGEKTVREHTGKNGQ
ncbi:MAG: DUF1385 domain-containing protein [Lachnospiraceae bacterium]|nr:DUF1385 domain-containing protein [Lachnospiraceae bacterium]